MPRTQVIFFFIAISCLAWRLYDPKGSYAILFDAFEFITYFSFGSALTSKFLSILIVDQINGFLIGIIFVFLLSIFQQVVVTIVARFFANICPSCIYQLAKTKVSVASRPEIPR